MKEFVEKLNEKLTYLLNNFGEHCEEWGSDKEGDCHRKSCSDCVLTHAIEIVNQLAEEYAKDTYVQTIDVEELVNAENDGWIACSERFPEETQCYFVTWRDRATCKCYVEITEYDASSQEWLDCICQAGLLGYDIIAWQPLPAPYMQDK